MDHQGTLFRLFGDFSDPNYTTSRQRRFPGHRRGGYRWENGKRAWIWTKRWQVWKPIRIRSGIGRRRGGETSAGNEEADPAPHRKWDSTRLYKRRDQLRGREAIKYLKQNAFLLIYSFRCSFLLIYSFRCSFLLVYLFLKRISLLVFGLRYRTASLKSPPRYRYSWLRRLKFAWWNASPHRWNFPNEVYPSPDLLQPLSRSMLPRVCTALICRDTVEEIKRIESGRVATILLGVKTSWTAVCLSSVSSRCFMCKFCYLRKLQDDSSRPYYRHPDETCRDKDRDVETRRANISATATMGIV